MVTKASDKSDWLDAGVRLVLKGTTKVYCSGAWLSEASTTFLREDQKEAKMIRSSRLHKRMM